MIVEYRCGHAVDTSPYAVSYVRRELCPECKQVAKELMEKQHRLFKEVSNG